MDWAPCLNLGHDKINVSTLQAASDRATRTELRNQRMQEASSSVVDLQTGAQASEEDTGHVMLTNVATQTDQEVLYNSKSVQTTPPKTSDVGVQTDDWEFLMRRFFCQMTTRCITTLG